MCQKCGLVLFKCKQKQIRFQPFSVYLKKMDKFETTCRACNSIRSNLVSLFSDQLNEILSSLCPSISIHKDDQLPQNICFFCSKQLEIAYHFQTQCKQSDAELWQVVKDTIKKEVPQSEPVEDEAISEEEPLKVPNAEEDEDGIDESPEFLEDDEEYDDDMEIFPETDLVSSVEPSLQIEKPSKACFPCKICEKQFLTSGGLLLHLKLAHKNTKHQSNTFPCKYCNDVFDNHEQQRHHMKLEHKESEFTCPVCNKVFTGKSKLDHHLLFHQKGLFKCMVTDCKRTFGIKHKLTDHLKRFHGIFLNKKKC